MALCLLVPTKVRSNPGGAEHRRVFFLCLVQLEVARRANQGAFISPL